MILEIVVVIGILAAVFALLAVSRSVEKRSGSRHSRDHLTPRIQDAKVVHVIDGDTCVLSLNWRRVTVRLDGIDCPELDQEWGTTAKAGLIKLIGGRRVTVETHGTDHYGRVIATVFVWHARNGEWLDVNRRMVMLGHAWVSRVLCQHLPPERRAELFRIQRWARRKRVGLWRSPEPVPPWQHRAAGGRRSNVRGFRRFF